MAAEDELTFEDELKRVIEARPFQTFLLLLTSGERITIGSYDDVIVGANVVSVIGRVGEWVIRKNQVVAAFLEPLTQK